MTIDYATMDARARGLALHLCSREELERWAALPDPPALGRALVSSACSRRCGSWQYQRRGTRSAASPR